jgi:crossover junction endodeoxyribonuclease RusA
MLSMQWKIFVAGLPIAQPRTRATAISGHARLYTPNNGIRAWKQSIQIAARQVWHGEPMTGPMRVDCRFIFPRVDSQIWKRKPMPAIWHCKKPDRDNLDKAVLDALTGIFWIDDCHVCDGRIEKHIASGDDVSGVHITITRLGDLIE